jgi:RecB family exonuclease
LLRRSWDKAGYRSEKEAEDAYERAENMLRRYYAQNDPRRHRVVALESKFSEARSSDGLLITGRVDRIDIDEGQYVIVDYKTGRFGEDQFKLDESLPLTLYAIAVSWAMGRPVSRIAIEHLTSGRRAETWRDRERQASDWRKLTVVAKQMRDGSDFPAKPSSLCRWCDYLVACPEGRASLRVQNEAPVDVPLVVEEPL